MKKIVSALLMVTVLPFILLGFIMQIALGAIGTGRDTARQMAYWLRKGF